MLDPISNRPTSALVIHKSADPCSISRCASYAFTVTSNVRQKQGRTASNLGNRLCVCYTQSKADQAEQPGYHSEPEPEFVREQASLSSFANNLRGKQTSNSGSRLDALESQTGPVLERAFLVGVAQKGSRDKFAYNVHESLEELGRLAETAGLEVSF